MMYLVHMICKKWLLLAMRHRFFVSYTIFFAIFYCVIVLVVLYQAYGYSEVQTLTTLVVWNFYILSLQMVWGVGVNQHETEQSIDNFSSWVDPEATNAREMMNGTNGFDRFGDQPYQQAESHHPTDLVSDKDEFIHQKHFATQGDYDPSAATQGQFDPVHRFP